MLQVQLLLVSACDIHLCEMEAQFWQRLCLHGCLLDPVYTRAKIFGFITKPERFSTGFMFPFTHAATNPTVNLLGFVPYPETLNPEKFVGITYPETFESGENSRVYHIMGRILEVSSRVPDII